MATPIDEGGNNSKYLIKTEENIRIMDPLLQNVVLRSRSGQPLNSLLATVSTDTGETTVEVIVGIEKGSAKTIDALPSKLTDKLIDPVLIGDQYIIAQALVKDIQKIHALKDEQIITSLKAPKPALFSQT